MWKLTKEVVQGFSQHDVMTKAAALALYCALGLAPMVLLVLLVLAVTAWLGPQAEKAVVGQVETMIGRQAGSGVTEVIKSTKKEQQQYASGTISAILGLVAILFSVSGIFAQLQASLNDIWDVTPRPQQGWWRWLRTRLLSVGTLLSVLFLMLVSLLLSAALEMFVGRSGTLWNAVNIAASAVVYVGLFALVFKLLPDVTMRWRDVWVSAALTALLFVLGKYLIGVYLGHSAVASSYGAAGSLVALIVWVYYSAIIVFVGAEVGGVYARHFGAGIQPAYYAMRKNTPEPVVGRPGANPG